tara:strand:- start:3964 stop:5778 length:1815 start_codon:yes stop_codon:yes gene_type:complete
MASKAIGFLNFKFSADLTAFERAMKKAQKKLKKFGKNLKKTGQTLSRNLTLPILALGAASIKAFDQQAKAETKLLTALKGREDVQQRLIAQAKELQEVSLFGDEATIEAQAMLAMFGLNEEQITMLIPAIQDMAQGINMDLVGATSLVAKTVSTSTDALKRYLDTGLRPTMTMHEKAIVLTDALTKKFKGQAKQASEAGTGPLVQMWMALGDLSEEIGERLMPYVLKLVDFIDGLISKFDSLSESQKDNIVFWGLIVSAIGPLLIILGTLSLALAAIASPIGLVTLAISSLVAGFIYLKTSTSNIARVIRNTFKSMANAIIAQINNIIMAYNRVSDFVNANQISLVSHYELEEKSSGSGSGSSYLTKRWQEMKQRGEIALKNAKIQAQVNKLLKESTKGLTTETKAYSKELDPLIKKMKEYADVSTKMWQDGGILEGPENMLNWTEKLTKAQEAHNATVVLLEDIMFSAAMSAANSQQKFFDSFIENIKQAIKQLLIQLAVLTVISLLLGGPTMTIGKAFSTAKGKVLGLEGFADGGLVYGPTTALIGEGVGTTASNPEVVAPLDKLKQYMGGGNQNIIVEGVLKGNDIYLSNRNTSINRLRTS